MLEPKRKLGFCASSVECLFFILNISIFACSAFLGGAAAYFYFNSGAPLAIGMDEVRTVLAIVGPTVALLSIVGMLVTAQNSHWFTKLYSFFLIVAMVSQCVVGVYLLMLQTTSSSRIMTSWSQLSPETRHLIEARLTCCGLNAVSESPDCRVSSSQACGPALLATQSTALNFLSTSCLVCAAVQVVCLLMAQFLAGQYKRLKSARRDSFSPTSIPGSPRSLRGQSPMALRTSTVGAHRHVLPESFRNHQPTSAFSPIAAAATTAVAAAPIKGDASSNMTSSSNLGK